MNCFHPMVRFATRSCGRSLPAFLLLLSLFGLSAATPATAQEEEKPTNLKVLDTALTHEQVDQIMDKFTAALGVGCDYCHVRNEGPNARGMNFAKDTLPTKEAARDMIRLVGAINNDYLARMKRTDSQMVAVQCVTCHRGQVKPEMLEDLLRRANQTGGLAAVDSTYRSLRKRYYGSHTFDFSDHPLGELAIEISEKSDSAALALLKLNQEFNPESIFNQWLLGQVYTSLGDTATAIAEYERALQINPESRRIKRDLEALRKSKTP
ncbi:MAG: c-type cytochrome [bacterium]|nr:c-type cytochrome [bacterium]